MESIPKTIHVIDDYYIGADKYCIILYKKGEITGEGSRKAKPENIGKEIYNVIGYYSDLHSLAKGLSKRFLLEGINDENVTCIKDLADLMAGHMRKIKELEEDYSALIAEIMEDDDAGSSEDNEEN